MVNISVCDNGVGIEHLKERDQHFGIGIMHERASKLAGMVVFSSNDKLIVPNHIEPTENQLQNGTLTTTVTDGELGIPQGTKVTLIFLLNWSLHMGKPYSILVVDDHPLLRKGICQLITSDPDFSLFGEAGGGLDALSAVATDEPDIILLDLNMKGMTGLDTLNAMRQEGVTSRIVILTVSDAKQDVIRLLRAGADGYLLKDTEPDLLLEKLKNAMLGHRVISEEIEEYLYELKNVADEQEWISSLTPRELQILQQLAEGLSNRMISEHLHISEGTVKVHVKNLLRKANAKSRTEMAVRYLNN